MLFKKDQKVFQYTVVFPLQSKDNTEIYSVRDKNGIFRTLKLVDHDKLSPGYFNEQGQLNEIVIRRKLHHPHISRYVESIQTTIRGHQYSILVTDYVSAESLSSKLARSEYLSVFSIKRIIKQILSVLSYLHTQEDPIIHNGIMLDNVLMDLSGRGDRSVLTGFSQSQYLSQDICHSEDSHQEPALIAPERRVGIKTVQSDIFSVGVLMYQMLYGSLPWEACKGISDSDVRSSMMLEMQKRPLTFPNVDLFELDDHFLKIIVKATQFDPDLRFHTAQEMIDAFDNRSIVEESTVVKTNPPTKQRGDSKTGRGFDDVAGMHDIKAMLCTNVINILKDRDRAKEYGISIPNGMLLYGPPGCGKSFFAEKFAEETGYFYKLVKASDLASVYIHGTQEKIGMMFNEAREKAPSILCFDEFDALVPKRNDVHNSYQAGEVNEFLSQLNNCGKDGVYVIATTNQPDMIDTAVLRKGRIDNIIYLPPPDKETRQAMFQIHLRGKPCDSSINYESLAEKTEHYVASDIAYIVNEAAISAFERRGLISQKLLEDLVSQCKPSLSRSSLKYYEDMRKAFENDGNSSNTIGFHL